MGIIVFVVWNSAPFAGDYGFEIAFEQQNKDTKSITWTVFVHAFKYFLQFTFTLLRLLTRQLVCIPQYLIVTEMAKIHTQPR